MMTEDNLKLSSSNDHTKSVAMHGTISSKNKTNKTKQNKQNKTNKTKEKLAEIPSLNQTNEGETMLMWIRKDET